VALIVTSKVSTKPGAFSSFRGNTLAFWNRKENRSATSGLTYPSEWLADSLSTGASPSGKRVTVQNALGVAPVWAAVSLISEQIGQLPLKVYKQVDGDRVEARSHRAWSLLHDKPNEYTPADRFWATVTTQLLLYGNAFIRKHRDGLGLVDELVLMNPAHMIVYWDGDQRIKQYNYQPMDGQIKGDQALRRFRDSLIALYGGSGKSHGVPVFEDGAKFRSVGSPLRDLEFVASQQMTRTDIAVMFKLPPNYLGGSSGDSLTYATVESNQLQFALHAIAPVTNAIAKALTADPSIMPQTIFEAEFSLEGMLRADTGARAEYYKTMGSIGVMTRNEIRRLENMPPITDGDVPAMPGTDASSAANTPPASAGGNGTNGNGALPGAEAFNGS
jgi:phage portal protein BeeE